MRLNPFLKCSLLVVLFFLGLLKVPSSLALEKRPEKILGLSYGPHERNSFDLWFPKIKRKTPLVVFIHGGGWSQGDKSEIYKHPGVIQQYTQKGIAFATINYRFLKHAPLQTIMREDIGGFIQHIRANHHKYHVDKNKILAFGISAGGSAALWLATHDDLANPQSSILKERKSTRILAAAHINAQVSYDFVDWFRFFGKEQTLQFLGQQVWSRYHLNTLEDLFTPEGEKARRFLDSYENYSSDDPEILYYNSYKDLPEGTPSPDRDHFMHAPRHAKLLHARALEVGTSARLILKENMIVLPSPFPEVHTFFLEKINQKKKNRRGGAKNKS